MPTRLLSIEPWKAEDILIIDAEDILTIDAEDILTIDIKGRAEMTRPFIFIS